MITDKIILNLVNDLNSFSKERIGIKLPNGKEFPENIKHKIIFKNWEAVKRTLKDIEMGFGEEYMKGNIDIEGDLESVLIAGLNYLDSLDEKKDLSNIMFKIMNSINSLNISKDEDNIKRHYDLGNEFYRLWLDKSMTYSCAFFLSPKVNLEEAQEEKRRIIYEKLQLEDGDNLVDIGCGWGSVILEAAELFNIKCVGITLSDYQYSYIKENIEKKGLSERVKVYKMHYADLPKLGEKFSKVVSVGMFEHVGRENYKAFFQTINSIMKEEGLFLLHTIGKVHPSSQSRWIRKYIFPGGYLPSLAEIIHSIEDTNLNLIDIDDWRIHYYKTLKEWRKRFWNNIEKIRKMYGDEFIRMWDLYLVSSAVSFFVGSNHLFQILFSKGIKNDYPIIRRVIGKSIIS